jgi:protein-S-isoprenylcysteine O-methyltransferase Ste14
MSFAATLTCLAAFSSFGWGVIRFFTRPSGLTWRAGVVAVLGLLLAGWDLQAIWRSQAGPWMIGAAIVAHVVSMVIFWSAVRACGVQRLSAIFDTDTPVHLVRRGPYRLVRHPFYISYTIFWLAGWLGSGSLVALVGAVAMAGWYLLAIREEERKFAASPLAGEYAEYRRRAGLMWPGWPRRRHESRRGPTDL